MNIEGAYIAKVMGGIRRK